MRSSGVTASTQASTSALASSTGGKWAIAPSLPTGFNPIHVVVGPGKVLLVAGSGNDAANFAAGTFRSYVCSAKMDNCHQVATPVDMFCAGHVLLPDGRALVGGGTLSYGAWKGAKYMYAFNFKTESYDQLTPLEIGRWYPSMITTINGQTLITGGFDQNGALTGSTELFDYQTNTHHMLAGSHKFPLYPHIRLTVKLNYFFDGAGYGTTSGYPPGFWDPVKNTFTSVSGLRSPSQRSSAASCFVGDLRNQNLLVMGGGHPAISSTDKIRLSDTSPKFVAGPSLKAKKMYLNCLSLPDGKLLEVGGGTGNYLANASTEVSSLSSIGSTSWTSMNPTPGRERSPLPLVGVRPRRRPGRQHRFGPDGRLAQHVGADVLPAVPLQGHAARDHQDPVHHRSVQHHPRQHHRRGDPVDDHQGAVADPWFRAQRGLHVLPDLQRQGQPEPRLGALPATRLLPGVGGQCRRRRLDCQVGLHQGRRPDPSEHGLLLLRLGRNASRNAGQ